MSYELAGSMLGSGGPGLKSGDKYQQFKLMRYLFTIILTPIEFKGMQLKMKPTPNNETVCCLHALN